MQKAKNQRSVGSSVRVETSGQADTTDSSIWPTSAVDNSKIVYRFSDVALQRERRKADGQFSSVCYLVRSRVGRICSAVECQRNLKSCPVIDCPLRILYSAVEMKIGVTTRTEQRRHAVFHGSGKDRVTSHLRKLADCTLATTNRHRPYREKIQLPYN